MRLLLVLLLFVAKAQSQLVTLDYHTADEMKTKAYADSILAAARAQDTVRLKALIAVAPSGSTDSSIFTTHTYGADPSHITEDATHRFTTDAEQTTWNAAAPAASPTFTGIWTGSASMRGTVTFTTTGTRVALYIPGTASTDIFIVTPTGSSVVTTTNLTCLAKTDSLIVFRGSSGTSGAKMNWIRLK